MAIDKEQLLRYYRTHYLSRREVLFKLPLNLSIETFWPELLRRRKTDAIVLPLSDAVGKPYWFVLTDKMVTASELLCEEALCHDELFDPYRAPMTGAMTEEMFFTSFVEGAPIQLQEAMDFLQRGTEPESIYEQIIWNNRQAHSDMMRSIFKPLDENQVKSLVFTLTDGMDNCAEDYRRTDGHPIIAMGTENYEVLPASVIPERMREYYDFLAQPDIHPLIKAAIGQAYLLVSRPFPEGNERLSRMVSFAVLLQSGYDFFRDISISSMIARESYTYYKAMCEILRPENGGDLTYFAEYYLDLLVRSFNAKKAGNRKKEEEALASERELAKQPLRRETPPAPTVSNEATPEMEEFVTCPVATKQPSEATIDVIPGSPAVSTVDNEVESVDATESPPDFETALMNIPDSPHRPAMELITRAKNVIAQGKLLFTSAQWAIINDITAFAADRDCRYLYKYGIIDRRKHGDTFTYNFRFDRNMPRRIDDESTEGISVTASTRKEYDLETFDFWTELSKLETSLSDSRKHIAQVVRELIDEGIMSFTCTRWMDYAVHDHVQARRACDLLLSRHIVVNIGSKKSAIYRITLDWHAEKTDCDVSANSVPEPIAGIASPRFLDMTHFSYDPGDITDEYVDTLEKMASLNEEPKRKRIGSFLLSRLRDKQYTFGSDEYKTYHASFSKSVLEKDIRISINLGLITRIGVIRGARILYGILPRCNADIRSAHLNSNQKNILRMLFETFGTRQFSTFDLEKAYGKSHSSFEYHLRNFVGCGILDSERNGCLYYSFKVTPEDHPECFAYTGVTMLPTTTSKLVLPIRNDIQCAAVGY